MSIRRSTSRAETSQINPTPRYASSADPTWATAADHQRTRTPSRRTTSTTVAATPTSCGTGVPAITSALVSNEPRSPRATSDGDEASASGSGHPVVLLRISTTTSTTMYPAATTIPAVRDPDERRGDDGSVVGTGILEV